VKSKGDRKRDCNGIWSNRWRAQHNESRGDNGEENTMSKLDVDASDSQLPDWIRKSSADEAAESYSWHRRAQVV
jgi:hypothetical protein